MQEQNHGCRLRARFPVKDIQVVNASGLVMNRTIRARLSAKCGRHVVLLVCLSATQALSSKLSEHAFASLRKSAILPRSCGDFVFTNVGPIERCNGTWPAALLTSSRNLRRGPGAG